eukprot:TRINITY_DN37144_c0_g1_i1.p1 TRINITY_DN37144_c0_g1~~TRINITY_DN37144_c0_g1_i1.p1  ORF type:complete len:1736 (+),score=447.92 TRINITY_DN37144_c0_g1_i1:52-5259(+)
MVDLPEPSWLHKAKGPMQRLAKIEEELTSESGIVSCYFPEVSGSKVFSEVGSEKVRRDKYEYWTPSLVVASKAVPKQKRRKVVNKKVAATALQVLSGNKSNLQRIINIARRDMTRLDLNGHHLADADVVAVTCTLHAHPTITSLDLSSNPITDAGAQLLLDTITAGRNVTHISLHNTFVAPAMLRKLSACTDTNLRHQTKRYEMLRAKELSRFHTEQEELFEMSAKATRKEQMAEYSAMLNEYALEHRQLRMRHTVDWKLAKKKEYTRIVKARRAEKKRRLVALEETCRMEIMNDEQAAIRKAFLRAEGSGRDTVLLLFMLSLRLNKLSEKEGWNTTRRLEKTRKAKNEQALQEVADEETSTRNTTFAARVTWLERLMEVAAVDQEEAGERLRQRQEAEEEKRRKQEAEERRLEYEALCKKERDMVEMYRRERQMKGERMAKEVKEETARKVHYADEAAAFAVYDEMAAVDLAVSRAKSSLAHWESKLLVSWSAAPLLSITESTVSRVFFNSKWQGNSPLDLKMRLSHDLIPPNKMAALDTLRQRMNKARAELQKELTIASNAVRTHAVRWNEALIYGHKSQGKPAVQPCGELQYFPSSDPMLEEPLWLCDTGTRLSIMGGSIEATCDPASQTGRDCFAAPFGSYSTAEDEDCVTVPLSEGVTLSAIDTLINTIQYKYVGSVSSAVTRRIMLTITLWYPALCSVERGARFQSVEEAFSAVSEVKLVVKPQFIISPLPLKISDKPLEWVEARDEERAPEDKGVGIFTEAAIAPPLKLERGMIVSAPVGQCVVSVRVLENASADDQIVFKNGLYYDDGDERFDIDITGAQEITFNGEKVAVVGNGRLLTLKEAWGLGACSPGGAASGFSIEFLPGASFRHLQKVLRRLRFIMITVNLLAPQDRRQLEISLTDSSGNQSFMHQYVEIFPSDKPTTMTVGKEKISFRSIAHTGVSHELRQYIKPLPLPLFPDAAVTDVDTDHFSGGTLEIRFQSGQCKGDTLFITPDNEESIAVVEKCIIHNGVHVAALCEGEGVPPFFDMYKEETISQRTRKKSSVSNIVSPMTRSTRRSVSGGAIVQGIRVKFPLTGAATLSAVQAILRSVCFTSSYYAPQEGARHISVELVLGPAVKSLEIGWNNKEELAELLDTSWSVPDNDEYQTLTGKKEVKVTQPLFDLPPSHVQLEYREGSGAARLAPIDISQELDVSFDNGYIRVEVISGGCEDDFLFIKAGMKEEFKVRERKGVGVCLPEVNEFVKPYHGLQPSAPQKKPTVDLRKSTMAPEKKKETKTKLLKATALLGATSELKRSVTAMSAKNYEDTGNDLWWGQKYSGTIVSGKQQLLIKFAGKVTKKDVSLCLRSLSYTNKSNGPKILDKVLRITLKGRGDSVSQAIMQIEIKPVDDVTEFVIANLRTKYRPGQLVGQKLGCFPLTEMGNSYLLDPDTPWFDGGRFAVEFTSGAVKGDVLGFMTVPQQRKAKANLSPDNIEQEVWEGELDFKNQAIYNGEVQVATVENPRSSFPGVNNVKISFTTNDPPAVSISMATYIMNCITFASNTERLTPGHRALLFKISDVENPIEGKEKIVVDCSRPLLVLSGKNLFKQQKPITYGTPVNIIDKMTLTMGDGKLSSLVTQGSTTIMLTGHEDDKLVLPSNIVYKDGSVTVGSDVLKNVSFTDKEIHFEHNSISVRTLSALLHQLQAVFTFDSHEDRLVEITSADDNDVDPSHVSIAFGDANEASSHTHF